MLDEISPCPVVGTKGEDDDAVPVVDGVIAEGVVTLLIPAMAKACYGWIFATVAECRVAASSRDITTCLDGEEEGKRTDSPIYLIGASGGKAQENSFGASSDICAAFSRCSNLTGRLGRVIHRPVADFVRSRGVFASYGQNSYEFCYAVRAAATGADE